MFKKLDIIYVNYDHYKVRKRIIITSSKIMALRFQNSTSLEIILQVFCCSSLLVQIVGAGDRILGAHQGWNHNAQSIR
jgi:hypothetical protein